MWQPRRPLARRRLASRGSGEPESRMPRSGVSSQRSTFGRPCAASHAQPTFRASTYAGWHSHMPACACAFHRPVRARSVGALGNSIARRKVAPTLLLDPSRPGRSLPSPHDSVPLPCGAALSASQRTVYVPHAHTRACSRRRVVGSAIRSSGAQPGMTVERGICGGCFASQALRAL